MLAEHGAKVAVNYVSNEDAAKEVLELMGGAGCIVQGDQSSPEDVSAMVATVTDTLGPIDLLVNNAGIASIGTVEDATEADFDRVFAVNCKGVMFVLQSFVKRAMRNANDAATGGRGAIVNLASIASMIGLNDRFIYSASKGAVLTMTYSVATDYVKKGIRCNAVAPARIHTPFVDGYLKRTYPGKEQEMFATLSEYQPIGRMGKPREVAALILYLCSDAASFVTGACYPIDGGVTCRM